MKFEGMPQVHPLLAVPNYEYVILDQWIVTIFGNIIGWRVSHKFWFNIFSLLALVFYFFGILVSFCWFIITCKFSTVV